MKHQNKILKNSFILLAMIFFASVIGVLFKKLGFDNTNVVSGYIFAVLVVARFTDGYVFGLLATVMSTALFNLLFTEPYYTFKINNFSDIITFVIMIIISIMTGALTASVREATKDAKLKEIENRTLYELTNHLTDAKDIDSIGVFSTKAVYDFLSCKVGWINFDEEGSFNGKLIQMRENGTLIHREFILDEKELFNSMKNLRTEYYEMDDYCDFPVTNQKTVLAVLMLPKKIVYDMNISQKRMIHGIIESSALAIERFRSIQKQAKIQEETQRERYRANLLRAISHDLRTPLSGIMGTSEMLMSMTEENDPRYELANGIFKDANWLHSLVENILSLTKLQRNNMKLQKKPELVEEVVGVSLSVVEKRFKNRDISILLPEDPLIVMMDATLISQVLVNLLDNAIKHTLENEEIQLEVWVDEKSNLVYFSVKDRGRGIKKEDLPHIFQTFYTTEESVDSTSLKGIGLGLSICKSIVEAHGGDIYAKNREEGGAEFVFWLPIGKQGENDESN